VSIASVWREFKRFPERKGFSSAGVDCYHAIYAFNSSKQRECQLAANTVTSPQWTDIETPHP
jgi:hypothetical protein